jgi:hypothetical protein
MRFNFIRQLKKIVKLKLVKNVNEASETSGYSDKHDQNQGMIINQPKLSGKQSRYIFFHTKIV